MQELTFRRRFQIWTYTVSHGQLLLRSNKDSDNETRIDILFKDVAIVNLPTVLKNIDIKVAKEFDKHNGFDQEILKWRSIFAVNCDGFSGYVVAATIFLHEDEGEYYDPGHFDSSF